MSKPLQAPSAPLPQEFTPEAPSQPSGAVADLSEGLFDGPPLPEEPFFDGPAFPDEPGFFDESPNDFAPESGSPRAAPLPAQRSAAPRRLTSGRAAAAAGGAGAGQGPVPPADLPAERAILSACLSDPDAVALAQSAMRAADFYDPRHSAAFEAICTLALRNEPTDVISVYGELEKAGHGDLVGLGYLTDLIGDVGSSYAVEHYAKRVSKLATVRNILAVTHRVQTEGYKRGVDPDAYVQLVEHELAEALKQTVRDGPQQVGELVPGVFQGILDARARGGEVVGMSTGFSAVDRWHLGLHTTDLIVLAARPAMGKSAFALNMAFNVARNRRRHAVDDFDRARVAVFSLEMGREQLVLRLLSARSGVGLTLLRKGELSAEDEMQLREAAAELADLNLFLDDTPGLTPGDLRARCKRLEMQGPLDLVVVDYLQLMRGSGGATGVIKLHFDGPLTKFGNLDDRANDQWVGGH